MWPDRVSNPGPPTYESGALPIALRGPATRRREEVVFIRLRIGHTRITHSYLLNREEQPFCIACNQFITVKHILIDCVDFLQIRNKYFQANDLTQLFQDVSIDNILSFLKDINLFNKI